MINEVRTLLLDLPGQGAVIGDGEEYSDPAYRPATPLPGLAAVRTALFGADPDRRSRLLRLRRYLGLIHAGLDDHVTGYFDPRVTYLPLARGGFELAPAVAWAAIGGHAYPLALGGPVPQESPAGRIEFAWMITVTPDGGVDVVGPSGSAHAVPGFAGGLSGPVPLAGSGLTFRYPAAAPAATAWTVTAYADSTEDVGVVALRVAAAGAAAIEELFGHELTEPVVTWRNLWNAREPLPLRLGAALLALAWRTKALRAAGG